MKKFLTAAFVLLAMISCTKEDRNNTIVNQEERIDKYISSLKDVRIARNGGSNRIVYTEGTGNEVLSLGDSVKFTMPDTLSPPARGRCLQQMFLT